MDLCRLPGLMTQASRLAKLGHVQHRTRAASVAAVERAGIKILKVLYTVNIKMVFRHPKYYKELRKRNKSDQAISDEASTEATSVRPGPGLKPQATSSEPQASSDKAQASSAEAQASSAEAQAEAISTSGCIK